MLGFKIVNCYNFMIQSVNNIITDKLIPLKNSPPAAKLPWWKFWEMDGYQSSEMMNNSYFCTWSGDEKDEKESKDQPSVEVNITFVCVKTTMPLSQNNNKVLKSVLCVLLFWLLLTR